MKILVDSTLYSKKMNQDLRNLARHKFKARKPKIKTPTYTDKRTKKK